MKKFGKTKIKDRKEKRKIRIRNRVAQAIYEDTRKFGEKKIPNKRRRVSKFNKKQILENYKNEELD